MRLEVLISTMHQCDHSVLDRMRVDSDAVVINQCDHESQENFEYKGHKIYWINSTQRGLSKSRNMALQAATADICVVSDDDMEYRDGYADMIRSAFAAKPEVDMFRFQVRGIERIYKSYAKKPGKVNYLNSMKTSSVEMAFRRNAVIQKNLRFDEMIGAGTKFLMGEENAFLYDCLRKKLQIYYLPQIIADLHLGNSSWFSGYTEKYFIGRGAAFAAMDRYMAGFLVWQFAIRKYKKYKNECKPFRAIRLMYQGKKQYLEQKKALKG